MNTEKKRAILAVIDAVILITVAGPIIKLALGLGVDPPVIAFYRLFLTGIVCLAATMFRPERRAELRTIRARDYGLIALGGFFLALHYLTWIPSLQMTNTFTSVLLVTTQPIFSVVGAAVFFRERTPKAGIIGIGVSMLGVFIIAMGDYQSLSLSSTALWGDALALTGAFCAAMYFLCGRSVRMRLSNFAYMGLLYVFASAVLLVAVFASGSSLWISDPRAIALLVALAFVCTLGGHTVLNWALKYLRSGVISMALLGEPLGAAFWAMLFFGEKVAWITLAGGVLILLGSAVYTTAVNKADDRI